MEENEIPAKMIDLYQAIEKKPIKCKCGTSLDNKVHLKASKECKLLKEMLVEIYIKEKKADEEEKKEKESIKIEFPKSKFIKDTMKKNKVVKAKSHLNMCNSLILDNSYKSKLCSDISKVNYNKYTEGNIKFEDIPILRKPFCDNIMYFMLIPAKNIKNGKTDLCGLGTLNLNRIIKEYNNKYGIELKTQIKANRTINLFTYKNGIKTDNKNVQDITVSSYIEKVIKKNPRILERYNSLYPGKENTKYGYVSYKMALSENKLEDVLMFLKDYTNKLEESNLYLQDFDITCDYGCSFEKQEIIKNLMKQHDFVMQKKKENKKDREKTDIEDENEDEIAEYLKIANKIILDNDHTVGKNCLTYLKVDEKNIIRCKIYNKLAQSLESGSVGSQIGCHLSNWINNKEERLRNTIKKSLNHGFTRLEITIYSNKVYEIEYYYRKIEELQSYTIGSNKMLKTPICNQWLAFTEKLTSNMLVIDLTSKEIVLGMWCNTLTRKVAGTVVNITPSQEKNLDKLVIWIISHYSFAKCPINMLLLETEINTEEKDKDIVKAELHSYMKIGDNKNTYIFSKERGGASVFYSKKQKTGEYKLAFRENEPSDMGIIDTENVSFRIFDRYVNISHAPKCDYVETPPFVNSININTKRQRTKVNDQLIFESLLEQETKRMVIINTQRQKKYEEKVQQEREKKEYLKNLEKSISSLPISLNDLSDNTGVIVYAFKLTNTRYGSTYILQTNVGNLYSNSYITTILDNNLEKFDNYKNKIYYKQGTGYLFKFLKICNSWNKNNNKAAKLGQFNFNICLDIVTKETKEASQNILEKVPELKHKDLENIGSLKENSEYLLDGLDKFTYRNTTRYILKINNTYYCSNYWIEDLLKDKYNDILNKGVKIYIKSLEFRNTPTRKKELVFVF